MKRSLAVLAVACLALSALPSQAKEHRFNKKVDLSSLQQELVAAGFKVQDLSCYGSACVLRLDDAEGKNPSSIIAAHAADAAQNRRRSELAALRALVQKWKAGTITPAEKDDLILRFIALQLPSE